MDLSHYVIKVYTNKITIKHWAEEDKPREKLLSKGRALLSNAELLSIIIGSGCKNVSALELSKQVLSKIDNSVHELGKMSVSDLIKFKGIGEAKAVSIVAALELARRRSMTGAIKKPKLSSSKEAYDWLYSQMTDLSREVFQIILLNRNNRVIRNALISVGGLSGTVVDPKVIFQKALEYKASSIILAHNHPSGNLTPSDADISITAKLVRAATDLDIKILDHLIFGQDDYYSFADEGRI